jgi:steroid 5-alpha reductase family enzyme
MVLLLVSLLMTGPFSSPNTMVVTAFVLVPRQQSKSPTFHQIRLQKTNNFGPARERSAASTPPSAVLSCSPCSSSKKTTSSQLNLMLNPASTTAAVAAASILPAFLGYYKSEWGVSYGYGIGVAASAAILLLQQSSSRLRPDLLFSWHAAALVLYGVRLCVFLAIRTRLSAQQREFQAQIEERAKSRGSRLSRTPFLVSCGLLYYGLVSPVLLMSKVSDITGVSQSMSNIWKILTGMTYLGFAIAALGDLTKTWVKVRENDEKFLVTSGIFKLLRHPNYTGEIIGWTANGAIGILGTALILRQKAASIPFIVAHGFLTLVGALGINFVLLRATQNLEKRQKEMYGESEKYSKWVQNSWSGWSLGAPESKPLSGSEEDAPQLELNSEASEDAGSGI